MFRAAHKSFLGQDQHLTNMLHNHAELSGVCRPLSLCTTLGGWSCLTMHCRCVGASSFETSAFSSSSSNKQIDINIKKDQGSSKNQKTSKQTVLRLHPYVLPFIRISPPSSPISGPRSSGLTRYQKWAPAFRSVQRLGVTAAVTVTKNDCREEPVPDVVAQVEPNFVPR